MTTTHEHHLKPAGLKPDEPGVHAFVVDRQTLQSESAPLADPAPELVDQLISEAQRLRKEMSDAHRVMLERMFRVSQMWLAGAALLAGASLWKPLPMAWLAAAGYGLGFMVSLYGQRARPSAPLGIYPSRFNDWVSLRQPLPQARERLLSSWDRIIEQAHDELAWRAR